MTNEIKKIIAALVTGGALVGGGSAVADKINCQVIVKYEEREICIDAEVKEILDKQLPIQKGFGGVQFKQK